MTSASKLKFALPAFCSALALTFAGPATTASAKEKTKSFAPAAKENWNGKVTVTPNGSYTLGNPAATTKVTEYVSYTCSHCAELHKQADPVLRLSVIPKGNVSVTVTNLLRNPIDLTIAMLTSCGDPKTFFPRHNAFMATQETWLSKVQTMSREQQARWYQGDFPTRMRAIASDFDFYTKMEHFGMNRAKVDQCLADSAQQKKLEAQLEEAKRLGLRGTPSFTINGKVIEGHDWNALSQAITASVMNRTEGRV